MHLNILPTVSFAGLTKAGEVPSWASRWEARGTTVDELCREDALTGILVLRTPGLEDIEQGRERIATLTKNVRKSSAPVRIVINFKTGGHTPDQLIKAFRFFPGAASRVEVADGDEFLEKSLNEALAKYLVEEEERRPDPLAEACEVIAVTEPLLSENGRLSAKAVASALGIPWTRLAQLIGRTKQAVGKTPDSPAIQEALRPYERILRLRAVLPGKNFLSWMQRPNIHLDGRTPLQIIGSGRADAVAGLVESMLTGTPG